MTISAAQIREARRLLGRKSTWICKQSGVEFGTVLKAQIEADIGSVDPRDLKAIERALTRAGAQFIAENGGGAGVRLSKAEP